MVHCTMTFWFQFFGFYKPFKCKMSRRFNSGVYLCQTVAVKQSAQEHIERLPMRVCGLSCVTRFRPCDGDGIPGGNQSQSRRFRLNSAGKLAGLLSLPDDFSYQFQ